MAPPAKASNKFVTVRHMPLSSENETWIVQVGDKVIQKKALVGLNALAPIERLIYCVWVADYGMRNAGDLETASNLYSPFQLEAAALSDRLKLDFVYESFSLPTPTLAQQYLARFDGICDDLKSAWKPSDGRSPASPATAT